MKKIKFVNNSSPDLSAENLNQIQDNVEEEINNLEIGGRNLLLNSKQNITNSNYNIANYTLAEKPVDGEEYIFSLKGNLGEGKTNFGIYNTDSHVELGNLKYDENKDLYIGTFKWKSKQNNTTVNSTSVKIYAMLSSVNVASSIEWVKLEKGNKATDWSPAPEDKANASELGILSSLTTTNKTSLVNALNELKKFSYDCLHGTAITETGLLENKTFDDAMNLEHSTIYTITGNELIINGAGFPTDKEGKKAYAYGLLLTYHSYTNYAKTQIYITDGERGIWWRTRVGGSWNFLRPQVITTGVEFATDEYIDNKRVYRKRIDIGELPNASGKNVAHGLTNVKFVKPITGVVSDGTNIVNLPAVAVSSFNPMINVYISGSNIVIQTGTDRSSYTGFVDLYYTKN